MYTDESALLMRMMAFQDTMRQIAVAQQVDGTAEMLFQPLGRDLGIGMIIESTAHTGDAFDALQDGTDVVTDQNDRPLFVDFLQQGIEDRLKPLVDVRVRLVQNDHLRIGYQRPSQQCPLQLAATEPTDGPVLQPFQSHTGDGLTHLFVLRRTERMQERFLPVQSRQHHLVHGYGKLLVDAVVLGQIAHADFRHFLPLLKKLQAACRRLQQAENDFHQRRLSAAVGTDNPQEVLLIDRQVDIGQHLLVLITGRNTGKLQDG